jgi:phosphate transport system substrate-binding protein
VQLIAQGATFPLPVYDVWTKSFQFVDPSVNLTYAGTGSGAGKKAIVDGTVDFAGSDSVLKDEYKTVADLQMLPMLAGAVVPIFNLQSIEKDANGNVVIIKELVLDRQTLADIYQAKITKWNDPAIAILNPTLNGKLPDATITVVHRADSSGTTEIFTKALASFSADWLAKVGPGASTVQWPADKNGNGIGSKGNPGVAVAVQTTTNSIGYVELAYAKSNSIPFAQLINKAGKTVKADPASLASAMGDFTNAFDDRLNATIVDGSGAGSWPITGYTYLIVRTQSMKDCVKAQKVVEYIKWTLTDARAGKIASDLGYGLLPQAILDKVIDKLNTITCKGAAISK